MRPVFEERRHWLGCSEGFLTRTGRQCTLGLRTVTYLLTLYHTTPHTNVHIWTSSTLLFPFSLYVLLPSLDFHRGFRLIRPQFLYSKPPSVGHQTQDQDDDIRRDLSHRRKHFIRPILVDYSYIDLDARWLKRVPNHPLLLCLCLIGNRSLIMYGSPWQGSRNVY